MNYVRDNYVICTKGMQGEKGEIGPEGTPGQMGLPGKNVSKLSAYS